MPKYNYLAKSAEGKIVKSTEVAPSRAEMIVRLRSQNLFIISVTEVGTKKDDGALFSFVKRKGKRASVKLYDLTFFARNLATTLSSGVTLLRSLEILSSQTESARLEAILRSCSSLVKEGLSLSEAIGKYPSVFSDLWRGIIEVGEASGNLPFVLDRLADYLELRMTFERKIKSALIYPVILLGGSFVAVIIFLKFILPKFNELFDQFNIDLPLPTQLILNASKFMEHHFIAFLVVIGGLVWGTYMYMTHPKTRGSWDNLQLKIPLMGDLVLLAVLERLTSTIYILLESGLPLVSTLDVASRGASNSVVKEKLATVKEKVREGSSLHKEFMRVQFFPLLIAEMAKIGEETGTMPAVFKKISEYYQKELSTRVERLIIAFEPMMILFMGVVIGGLVVALFLPLFKVSTAAM